MKTKSGMTTQVRGLPCLSKSGHGKPRLSYNGHMPKPLSLHFGKSFPLPRPLLFGLCRRSPSSPTMPAENRREVPLRTGQSMGHAVRSTDSRLHHKPDVSRTTFSAEVGAH